jgi:hypothetical protein
MDDAGNYAPDHQLQFFADDNIGKIRIFRFQFPLPSVTFQALDGQFAVQRANDDLARYWLDGSIYN